VFGAVAALLLAFPIGVLASHQFSDVPTSNLFHGDITWGADNGIVSGFLDGTFKPNNPVTRGQSVAFLHRYNNTIEVVHHPGTMVSATEANNSVTCPAGKRPIAGGGTTDAFNLFITDVSISATSVTVRWETDNNATQSASTDAWATCVPD
jgi:hypothetical protein